MVDPLALIREQEARDRETRLTRAMSDRLREQHRGGRLSSAHRLSQALADVEAAKAAGDEDWIRQADAALEALLDDARAAAEPPVPDFGAGARAPVFAPPNFSDVLRAERYGWR